MTVQKGILQCLGEVLEKDVSGVNVEDEIKTLGKMGLTSINGIYFILKLEETFNIRFEPHELAVENINTIPKLYRLITSKGVNN